MKLFQIFVAILVVTSAHIYAAQQKQTQKRAGSPIQSIDTRPTTRMTTTSSSAQSLDEEDVKMACAAEQPRTRNIGTQTELQMSGNQIISHEKDEDLIQAAREGNLKQIQALFDPSKNFIPDINARDMKPINPEDVSLESIHPDEYGAGRMDGMTPLMMAADTDDIELARFLIEHGADLNMQTIGGMTALNIALEDNGYKWEDAYFQGRSHAHMRRSVDMQLVGPVPIARMLIEAGADVDKKGAPVSPLESALHWEKEDIIKLLLEHGAHGTMNILIHADLENEEMEARILLLFIKNGMDINERDTDNDWTPLLWAIISVNPNLVRDLLLQGANPYIRNNRGQNAFDLALLEDRQQDDEASHAIVKLLADYEKLQTPEHIAALRSAAQRILEESIAQRTGNRINASGLARNVQQFLRPSYRQEAENKENKEKEEKEKTEGNALAPMVDEG